MENKAEIWKALPGVAGVEVSTLGRVRTLDKMVWNGKGTWLRKGRVLKQYDNGKGYLTVTVKVNDKFITKSVHRLVAQTFIKNPDNLPEVNHKGCDPSNNNVSNLEWCSHSYNIQYREKFGKALNRPLFAINLTTLKVSRFRSQNEAGRSLGVSVGNISNVIKGKRKQANGFWFVNDDGNAVDVVKSKLHDIGKTGLKLTA